jgi:hypothetical protein
MDSQMKRPHFYLSRPKVVTYRISPSLEIHAVFFLSLISSQSSTRSGSLCMNEYEMSSIYDIPFHIWVDRACSYHFRKDSLHDQSCGYSF